jgi:hypothetical protein
MADFNPQYRQELAKKRMLEKNSQPFGDSYDKNAKKDTVTGRPYPKNDFPKIPGSLDEQRRNKLDNKFDSLRNRFEPYYPGRGESNRDLEKSLDPYINEKREDIRRKGEELQKEREQQDGFDPGKRNELNQARAKSKIAKAKNMASMARDLYRVATPLGVASLLKYIDWFKDWLYMIALVFAIGKDLIDFVGVGSLPAIGTIISICCSIMIFLLMLLAGSGGKRKFAKKYMNKFIVLIAGTLAEAVLFGLNFLPIETATVIIIYIMVLAERKQEKEAEDKERALGNAGDDEEEDEYD